MSIGNTADIDRVRSARNGRILELFTIVWASTEAAVALLSAYQTHSVSLAGFGWDSLLEVVSAIAVWWRMTHEMNHAKRHRAELLSLRITGSCLALLAAYIFLDALYGLLTHRVAEVGPAGIAITAAALVFMPLLSAQKRRVGRALHSNAMMTDARQTDFCTWQAGIVLLGLLAHRLLGITWADSVAALILVPILIRAAVLTFRGEHCCSLH